MLKVMRPKHKFLPEIFQVVRLLSTRLPCAKTVPNRFNRGFSQKEIHKDIKIQGHMTLEGQPQLLENQEKLRENNWKQLACVVDRMAFLTFLTTEIILYLFCLA